MTAQDRTDHLTPVALRRDLADAMKTDPQWQGAGLGARTAEADRLVQAALMRQDGGQRS